MRNKSFLMVAALTALLLLLAACSDDEEAAAPESQAAPPSEVANTTDGDCDFTPPETPAAGTQYKKPGNANIDPAGSYTAVMETSCGTMRIALSPETAPETVNNFVFLAGEGWYDGIRFHRIVPGFVIQAGDPTCSDRANPGCGSGGPGYAFDDELSGKEKYAPGTFAMANSGPNTNGSQFFVVTGQDAASLPPSYTVFGELADDESLAVATTIEGLPTTPDNPEAPADDIWIRSVTIEEG